MSFDLSISRAAGNYLRRLDRRTQARMAEALHSLVEDPYQASGKPLHGVGNRRSMRVGDWRIVYLIDEEARVVHIDRIAPRGQVYRDL